MKQSLTIPAAVLAVFLFTSFQASAQQVSPSGVKTLSLAGAIKPTE